MDKMDIGTELHKLENSIRDLIEDVLERALGSNWLNELKISRDRIKKWEERRKTEEKRLKGNVLETRLLYYSGEN